MSTRVNIKEMDPAAYQAISGMEAYGKKAGIDPLQKELIKIRASQMNGCAYCINMHTKDARKLGETEQRIYLLNAWRESPQFTAEERVILAMTEEITLINQKGLTDQTYGEAIRTFGEERTINLIMLIITINGWNRYAIATHMQPE
jgi:AhpD family alkylhydroperoxidase